jgi:glycosyltransferase involved in cell wall biosynthesis
VTSAPPLVEGGHLVIARALVTALRDAGHDAGLVTTASNRFGRQTSAYLSTWFTDVGRTADGHPVDQVISLRYPSYAVRHPAHVCWLNHTMREYYDQWDRFSSGLSPQGRLKERVRRAAIHATDRYLLKHHVTRLFVQSKNVQDRLSRWLHVSSEVLHPPAPQRNYRCDGFDDFIFVVSRLAPLKRIDLVVRALAEPRARGVRCVIAGEGSERPVLEALARDLGVADRVTFVGHVDDAALADYLARCRAVCFVPYDEDYGLVTVEGFASGKAVITCRDSGAPTELVKDGETGCVVEPAPAAIAEALARLSEDRPLAERLGSGAHAAAQRLDWAATVKKLVIV